MGLIMLVLEFTTQQAALDCLDAINAMLSDWWKSQGWTVINNQLIGQKNGVDAPESAKTITWDTVKEINGNFYIASLTGSREEWADWKNTLAGYGFTAIGQEKQLPASLIEPPSYIESP